MRIEQTVDALQGQSALQPRAVSPPATVTARRVLAIGQAQVGEEQSKVLGAPPDDAIMLDLSAEGREAARKAAIDQLQKRLMGDQQPAPDAATQTVEERRIEELRQKDRSARAREQAVRAAAGSLSAGAARYHYQVGPDGRLYIVDSEVDFDTSEVPGDPEATLRKAEQLQRAALAPGDPSPQDRAVAAMAAAMAARARQELRSKSSKASTGEAPAEAVRATA
jgi:hypothetical protein